MGSRTEQDRFLQCLKYSKKMIKLVRNDRHVDPWKNAYSEALFFTTYKGLVSSNSLDSAEEDLPTTNTSRVPRKPSGFTATPRSLDRRSTRKPFKPSSVSGSYRMKQLHALHNDVNFDVNNLASILDVMQVPADGSADTELQLFSTALYQLDRNLDKFHQRPCAVCHQTGHSFQQCPLLQNAGRVRDVYGKLVAYLNRFHGVATKLNKSLQDYRSTPVLLEIGKR